MRGLRRSGGGAPAGADEAVPAPRSAEHGTNATDKDKTSQAGPVSGGGAGAAEPRRGGFTEEERRLFPGLTGAIQASASPPFPSRINWTSLVPPLVLTGQDAGRLEFTDVFQLIMGLEGTPVRLQLARQLSHTNLGVERFQKYSKSTLLSQQSQESAPPPTPPSRTDWTRLVPPPVLTGHVERFQKYSPRPRPPPPLPPPPRPLFDLTPAPAPAREAGLTSAAVAAALELVRRYNESMPDVIRANLVSAGGAAAPPAQARPRPPPASNTRGMSD